MPKKLYACEVCGTTYTLEEYASDCEKSHNHVVRISKEIIKRADNNGKYPIRLIVEMSDGAKVEYKR